MGLIYFLLYRVLLLNLGVQLLGVWSLIIATSSLANLANVGFTSGLVKFVSEFNAKDEQEKISKLLFTSFFSMLLFLSGITLIIFLLATLYVKKIVPAEYVKLTLSVLPYSLFCLLINSLGGVFISALEGFQRNYIRNIAYIFTSIGYFGLAILLLPEFGLKGLAIAQIIQAIVILFVALYHVKKLCPTFRFATWNWDKTIFRSIFNYGYKFQIISIFQMLFEPMTKILISRYSGISTLGFYEMASRFVNQIRAIISTMNQVTVPVIAHYSCTDKNAIFYIYKRSISFIISLVFPFVAGIILFGPHLSVVWIGDLEPVFVNSTYILSFSLLINILNAPAFFSSLGEGKLNGLLVMHFLIAILNILFGVILGKYIPSYGVIIAWALSQGIGSVFLILFYHRTHNINFSMILCRPDYVTMISGTLFSVLSILFFFRISFFLNFNMISFIILLTIYLIYFFPMVYISGNLKLLRVFIHRRYEK